MDANKQDVTKQPYHGRVYTIETMRSTVLVTVQTSLSPRASASGVSIWCLSEMLGLYIALFSGH